MEGIRYCSRFNGLEKVRIGVAVALVDQHNRLLMELRSDVLMWGLIGGRMEPSETPRECGCREVQEETGIKLNANELIFFDIYGNPADMRIVQYPDNRVHLVDIVYTCRLYSPSSLRLSEESIALTYFEGGSIPKNVVGPAIRPIDDLIRRKVVK